MKQTDFVRMSFKNIFSSPVRSFLTVLGMAIGVGAILAVITLGDAGQKQVKSEMTRLGIDKVWMTAGGEETLTLGDGQMLADNLDTLASEQAYLPVQAANGEKMLEAVMIGCSPMYLHMMDCTLIKGQMFTAAEWNIESQSVLIGETIAEKLGVDTGDLISLSGRPFRIKGIISFGNQLSQIDSSGCAVLPIETYCRLAGKKIHEVTIHIPKNRTANETALAVEAMMQQKRAADVETTTMQVQIDAAESVMMIFINVLKWIAAICMIVGGIGVMNIQLVSVRERRREIGIMKSMGTTPIQICTLFLLEAAAYAMTGGASGLIIGVVLVEIAGRSIGLNPMILSKDCMMVFVAALGIGLFFGVVPAAKAARLMPVRALKND